MVFAKHLRKIGNNFRQEHLNSNDKKDLTELKYDWRKNERKDGSALGGPYLAIHLRRADFLYARKEHVPSLDGAIQQVKTILKKENLDKVFLATDALESGTYDNAISDNYSYYETASACDSMIKSNCRFT